LHLKINTCGSFSPVSAISPQFLLMAGEKYLSAREKAKPCPQGIRLWLPNQ